MIAIFTVLAVLTGIACFLTERVDRQRRRAERLLQQQKQQLN